MVRVAGTDHQIAASQVALHHHAAPPQALQQGSSSNAPQNAAISLAAEGKSQGKLTQVQQHTTSAEGSSPARQQKKAFSLSALLGLKKTSKSGAESSAMSRSAENPAKSTSLRELMAQDTARLTRSAGVRRQSLDDMAGRPMAKGESHAPESTAQQRQEQLHNFSQMRQAMLNKINHPEQAATSVAPAKRHHGADQPQPAAGPLHTEDTLSGADDDEFNQLHQQRLAREQASPPKPPRLGEATPVTAKFQPRLAPIVESVLEGLSAVPPKLQGQLAQASSALGATPLAMSLHNGKIALAQSNPPALNTLLLQTLGKSEQHYAAHHASEDGHQHLLLDGKGRLFDVKSNGSSYSVLHSSQSVEARETLTQAIAAKQRISMTVNDKTGEIALHIDGKAQRENLLRQPGEMHRAMLTGIHSHPAPDDPTQNEQVRLHDSKIHVLHPELEVWQQADDRSHSQLSRQADGKLYALEDNRTLRNLTDNQASEKFVDKIKSFAVGNRGQVAILTDTPDRHQMSFMPSLSAAPEQRVSVSLQFADPLQALKQGQAHLEAQSVAINQGRLFAADSEGKLYLGTLPQKGQTELPMKAMAQPALERHFGHDYQVSGFFTDDRGQLNALVKDNFKQQHACPLGDDHQFHPGWNLSDTLVLDNQLGLHHLTPQPDEVLDMGRQGRLTLQEGKVHYFDQLTNAWTGAEADCKQLKKGLDGDAYILKEGEVKRLSINQSSASIKQGADNLFTLPHLRHKPEPGSALPGLDKADKAQAMAVISANKYLALSEKGEIRSFQIKPGTQQLERPAQTLSREGLRGELKDILVDHQQNLYALNHDGEVFTQARGDWQHHREGSGWQKVDLPQVESGLKKLEMNDAHQPVATLEDGSQHRLGAQGWQAHSAPAAVSPAATRSAETVYSRLSEGMKGGVLPGSGVTVKASAQLGGQSGMENRKIASKFADRVRAYAFNPTLAPPRWTKNAAYSVQHNWQGREGLRPVYEMQSALIKQLEAHNVRQQGTQPDLHTRLAALNLGDEGKALVADLKRFGEELEHSATRSVTQLGQHQGVLKSSGDINPDFQPSSVKAMLQSMNINRSGHDLSKSLLQAVRAAAPSADSKLEKLLNHFVSAGVNMSHQKDDIPLGRQRDPNDRMALTKSRLILDIVTLGALHQLADKAALISGHNPDSTQLKQLRQAFDALREQQYGGNPVKHYTDMGFTHHKALEADYDAVKAFINAFKKEHHGVNLTARTVLETKGNEQLEHKLKDTLLSLDKGESINFSRAYGGGISTAFVPTLKKVPVPIVPGGGITLDRAYSLNFSRGTGGLNVSFSRDGGATGTISVSTGHDLMPYMTGKKTTEDNASDWLSKKHKISPDFRIGGGVSSSVQGTLQNSLKFKLTEGELPEFIHGLVQGKLTPAELMAKGIEHQMKQGSKLVFNIDTSAALDLRAGINITQDGSKPNTVTARVSAGLSAAVNVLSVSRERSTSQGQFGSTISASDNRPTLLNTVTAGANLTATVGVSHASTNNGKSVGTFPAFAATNVAVALALDNRTKQSISLELKQPEPITANDISELTSTLGKHFKDSVSSQLLEGVKTLEEPVEQLAVLKKHFSAQNVVGDERYEAIRSLNTLALRQQALEGNQQELVSASHSTDYNNLSKLNSDGLFQLLHQHINASLPPSNAQRLSGMMESNNVLNGLIKQLQSTPFSSASIALELKDELREKTQQAVLEGKIGRDEVGLLFQDRNNLRIKSVSVNQSVSKSEGFSTPALLLGTSNSAGLSMVRNAGTINFKYGQDQETPRSFTLEGEIAKANPQVASALAELKKEGLEIKS